MNKLKGLILHAHEVRQLAEKGWVLVVRPSKPQPHPKFLARGVVDVVPQWPHQDGFRWFMADGMSELVACPYAPGTRFFVKETWSELGGKMHYKADLIGHAMVCWWNPAPHMLALESRFTVETNSIKCYRLNEITGSEIIAQGLVDRSHHDGNLGKLPVSAPDGKAYVDLKTLFRCAWNAHNPKHPWSTNPWCWMAMMKKV